MTLQEFVQLINDKDIRYKFGALTEDNESVIGICLGKYVWDYFKIAYLIPGSDDITLRFLYSQSTQSPMVYPSKGRGIERKKMLAKRMSIQVNEI